MLADEGADDVQVCVINTQVMECVVIGGERAWLIRDCTPPPPRHALEGRGPDVVVVYLFLRGPVGMELL